MDPRLHQNQSELAISVLSHHSLDNHTPCTGHHGYLAILFQVFANGDGFLDHVVQIFRNGWGQTCTESTVVATTEAPISDITRL